METVSLALIIVGLAIIAVVLLMRWRMRQRQSMPPRHSVMPTREEPVDFDPLFAIDRARDERDGARGPAFRRRRHRRGGAACGPRIGYVVDLPLLPAALTRVAALVQHGQHGQAG